ncbi:MAG: tetratricopeptide repeat protein [Myxococcota bacterium]
MEDMLEKMERPDTSFEKAPIAKSNVARVNLDVHWRLWKRVLSKNEAGVQEVKALRDDATSLGIPNLPDYATSVYALARTKADQGELAPEQASRLFEVSEELAPDLPYPSLAYSSYLIDHQIGRLPAIVGNYTEGIKKGWAWLDSRTSWELKFITLGLVALLGSLIFFLLGQMIRYFGIIAYDGARLLPKGFSSNQTVVLVLAVIVVPGLLLQSPFLSLVILLALLGVVQQINERIITVLLFGALAALPTIEAYTSNLITWPGSESQQLMHAQYLGCEKACSQELEATWLSEKTDDPMYTYTLALAEYRKGDEQSLERVIELLESRDTWPESMRTEALNLWGATLIAQADPAASLEKLERAHTKTNRSAAPVFNMMRAHQMLEDASSASSALDQAMALDIDRVRRHMRIDRRDINSSLMVGALSGPAFMQYHRGHPPEQVKALQPIWQVVAGPNVPFAYTLYLGLGGILLTLLTLPLYLTNRPSTPCPKCGLARDPNDAEKTGDHRYCLPCYRTFVSGAKLDYDARVHNERVLGRRERFQDALRRILSILMPGTGHIEAGHGLGGFIISFLMLFGVLILLRPLGLWRPAYELFHQNWGGQMGIAVLLISIGGVFALSAAARGVTPTEARSKSTSRADRETQQ